jgi:hypothetical protein
MNQGNVGRYTDDDGVWQDGGVLVRFAQGQWTGVFLKFQSQGWHTDDRTGQTISGAPAAEPPADTGTGDAGTSHYLDPMVDYLPDREEPHGLVRIVAALVNPTQSPEVEVVTLLNTAPHDVQLDGWALLDTNKPRLPLSGSLSAGTTRVVHVNRPWALSNKGGIISLIDERSLKVDGVSYTHAQAQHPGWTLVF